MTMTSEVKLEPTVLAAMAAEIVEWRRTGLLKQDGHLVEFAEQNFSAHGLSAIRMAEDTVCLASLKRCAAILAMDRRASPVDEPVAWMHEHAFHGPALTFSPLAEGDIKAGWLSTPLYASPPAPAVTVPELLTKALAALDLYGDPTAYVDGDGEPLDADEKVHQGMFAQSAAAEIRAALAAAPQPPATRSYEEGKRIERLKVAIEGECDGLALDDASAKIILAYVDTGDVPDDLLRSLKGPRDESMKKGG